MHYCNDSLRMHDLLTGRAVPFRCLKMKDMLPCIRTIPKKVYPCLVRLWPLTNVKYLRSIIIGILNYTRTALGRSLMRTWLLRPLLSLPVIGERHDAVECFTRPENQVPCNTIHAHLKGVKNLPRILSIMKSGRAKLSDWQALVKVMFTGFFQ